MHETKTNEMYDKSCLLLLTSVFRKIFSYIRLQNPEIGLFLRNIKKMKCKVMLNVKLYLNYRSKI